MAQTIPFLPAPDGSDGAYKRTHALREKITITGNLALPDEVYLAIVEVPEELAINDESAALVGGQIQRFLRRAGYVLSRVGVEAKDTIRITIDEGRVSRVVFRGKGTLKSIMGKSMLDIPHNIFNKPWLERQLKDLESSLSLISATYELVPSRLKSEEDIIPFEEIETLGLLKPLIDFDEKGDYELHIFLNRSAKYRRIILKIGADKESGFVVRAGYASQQWFMSDDRLKLYSNFGSATYKPIGGGDPYSTLALFQGGAEWYLNPLWKIVRPQIWLSVNRESRQRFDLNIERYTWTQLRASANIEIQASRNLKVFFGGGIQRRSLYDVVSPNSAIEQDTFKDLSGVFSGALNWVFSSDLMRLDRDHYLTLQARWIPPGVLKNSWRIRWDYQKWFSFGWSGLRLGSKGSILTGDTLYTQDEPVGGRYLRGVFGRTFYVHRVGSASIEYRQALKRDLAAAGIFLDVAGFQPTQGQLGTQIKLFRPWGDPVVFGAATGIGVHFLFAGMYQLSVDYAFGVTFSTNRTDFQRSHGPALKLRKAF